MKHRRLCLFVAMLLTSLCSFAQFSGSGSGTASDPYLIYNETQLSQLSNFLGQSGVVFSLQNDLDLTSWIAENSPTQGWQPIGVESSPFKGVLLGNGYTISGLSISRSSQDYVGLFGNISGATISNLTLKCGAIKGGARTGVFAGNASSSTLTNIKVEATTISGSQYCGGLIGYTSNSSFSSCVVMGNISGGTDVGGAVGISTSSLNMQGITVNGNCSGTTNVGGLVGELANGSSATLISCKSKGTITNTGDYTGGLIGKSDGACISGIESSSHSGEIQGANYVGGLVGAILDKSEAPTLYDNYEVWDRSLNGHPHPDGIMITSGGKDKIVEGTSISTSISNCAAIGNITGMNYVGGLIGIDNPAMSYPYTTKSGKYTYRNNTIVGNNKTVTWVCLFWDRKSDGSIWHIKTVDPNTTTSCDYTYKVYTRNYTAYALSNSYYSGDISAGEYVGGVVGQKTAGDINNCYAYGSVCGTNTVGGIVGKVAYPNNEGTPVTTIKSSVANCSTVSATASGADVGRVYGAVQNNTVIGATGSNEGNLGLTTCELIMSGVTQTISDDAQHGQGIDQSLLRQKGTYELMGWDFSSVWGIFEGEEYPYLVWQLDDLNQGDVNADNSIDVADYIGLANLILSGSSVAHAPKPARLLANAPMKAPTDISTLANALYVEPLEAVPGTQQELSIQMKNAVDVAGFEFSLRLPAGITVALNGDSMPIAELSTERTTKSRTTNFNSAIQADGTLKVLCGTTAKNTATGKLYTFSGNTGEVARITVDIPAGFTEGVYDVDIVGGMLADPDAAKTTLEPVITSALTVNGSVTLDEDSDVVPASTTGDVNIKVKRTIKGGEWSTICLPFDMTENQLYDAFGTDVKLAEFDSYDVDCDAANNVVSITINFTDANLADGLYANYPYIIKTSADISEFNTRATITPDEENALVEYDNGLTGKRREVYGTFYGTYHANTTVPAKGIFISANKFYYSKGLTKMKAFRAYFMLEDILSSVEGAQGIRMKYDDATTGVSSIVRNGDGNVYYDLQGRSVVNPTNGIYIQGGSKVYIKK